MNNYMKFLYLVIYTAVLIFFNSFFTFVYANNINIYSYEKDNFIRLFCINILSIKNSYGYSLFAIIPPTFAAALIISSGFSEIKNFFNLLESLKSICFELEVIMLL